MATRNERVRLSLEDAGFTAGMAKAAGATALLDRALNDLDGSHVSLSRSAPKATQATKEFTLQTAIAEEKSKRLKKALRDQAKAHLDVGRTVDTSTVSLNRNGREIDRYSGRLALIAQGIGAFGPGLVPIGAAVVPVLAGMTAQIGSAALGAGVLLTAFQGVGDALEVVNKAHLEPTEENIAAAEEAMNGLSESAQAAVYAMRDLGPALKGIRDSAAEGFFPGFIEGLDDLERLGPTAERIFGNVAEAAGGLFSGAASELASGEWREIFAALESGAGPMLVTLGQTVGNLTKGFAELGLALDPLTDFFTGGLLDASETFESWAEGLDQTEGYQEFIDYVRETGPQVLETLGSLGDAILQIAEAASPLGGPVLQAIEAFADAVASIADSPLGTPIMAAVTAMSALSLATRAVGAASATSFGTFVSGARAGELGAIGMASGMKTALGVVGKGAGIMGGMALATSDLGESMGITNTAMFASMGLMAGPWGAAVGAGAGLMMDIASASKRAAEEQEAFQDAMKAGDLDTMLKKIEDKRKELRDFEKSWRSDVADALDFMGTPRDVVMRAELAKMEADYHRTSQEAAAAHALSLGFLSDSQLRTAQMTQQANAALREQHSLLLESMSAETGYEGALNRLHATVKDGSGAFERNGDLVRGATDEQIRAAEALYGTAAAWAELTPAERRARGGIKAAKEEFIRAATAMNMGKEAARNLANELFNIPANTRANVDVDVDDAMRNVRSIRESIANINGKTVYVDVVTRNDGSSHVQGLGTTGRRFSADGDTVPKTGLPYADRHPYLLADGEEVISNRHGQADRHRSLLKAINDNRLADGGTVGIPGLAGGGTARFRGSLDDRLAFAQLQAEIGRMRRDLAKSGKDGLAGKQRQVVELQLQIAQRDLRRLQTQERRERLEAQRDKLRERLGGAREARSSLAGSVRDSLRSDLFATDGNAWAAAQFDPMSTLRADIKQARQFNASRTKLQRKGLDGGALRDLLQNADPDTVRAMSNWSKQRLNQYENTFELRQRVTGRAGRAAGDAVMAKEIAKLGKRLDAIEKNTRNAPERTGGAVGKEINGAARRGTRRGRRG